MVDCLPYPADNSKEVLIAMKKGGGSQSTIIIGQSKSVLVYALHSLEYVLGLAQFRVFHSIILMILGAKFLEVNLYLKVCSSLEIPFSSSLLNFSCFFPVWLRFFQNCVTFAG